MSDFRCDRCGAGPIKVQADYSERRGVGLVWIRGAGLISFYTENLREAEAKAEDLAKTLGATLLPPTWQTKKACLNRRTSKQFVVVCAEAERSCVTRSEMKMSSVLSKEAEAAFPIKCACCGAGIQSESNSGGAERRTFRCQREVWCEISAAGIKVSEVRHCEKSPEGLTAEIRQRADWALRGFEQALANVPREEMRAPFDTLLNEVRAVADAWATRNGLFKDGRWRNRWS